MFLWAVKMYMYLLEVEQNNQEACWTSTCNEVQKDQDS